MTFSPAIREDEEMHLAIQLVVVEGKEAKNIAPEDALEYILGYTIAVTARIRKVGDQTDPGPGYDGQSISLTVSERTDN
jgi:2-keto-4-pentenoate hydratase/2-oxohepta-3-ene-1,7-dioic acid hydratase in catechol pathway